MNSLRKVAIVTGAAGGIGKVIARRLVNEGMNLAVIDIKTDPLSEFANSLSKDGHHLST